MPSRTPAIVQLCFAVAALSVVGAITALMQDRPTAAGSALAAAFFLVIAGVLLGYVARTTAAAEQIRDELIAAREERIRAADRARTRKVERILRDSRR